MQEETEIKKISSEDKNYPFPLRKIRNPPKVLYYKGNLFLQEKCFAVVGTRRNSLYGKEIVSKIIPPLVKADLTIVSGLAPGIDTLVHKTTLQEGGRTIAVLGTGLDEASLYPKSNISLAREIIKKGGLLLSEYPPGTRGTRFTFPQRNRIISGLSLGVLVVEAPKKSGAVITASWAKKQKRMVFAVPGNINSPLSQGCNYLIQEGAFLVKEAKDILEKLGIKVKKEKREIQGKNAEENLIINILRRGTQSLDEIIIKTNLPSQKIIAILSKMEIEGKVENLGQNIFTLK